MRIKAITDAKDKQQITRMILADLPAWFGIEAAINDYVEGVKSCPFFVAFNQDEPVGFYALKEENERVLDLYVLGVKRKWHHQGVGSLLQKTAEAYALEHGYDYLMVLTLAEKANDQHYLLTRQFYLKQGFIDFYQNDAIFGKDNPCQVMMKPIKK